MPAIRHTISFTVAGTIDSFDTAGVKDRLRSYLQCFEPDCTVELRVTQGSVNVEAVVTDTRDNDSSTATVEAAAALSRESEAGLTQALGVTVQGDVTVSAPSSVVVQVSKSEVEDAGESSIDAGNNEDSAGLIVGVVVGCLALVVALAAGATYCYQKKKAPPPAKVQVALSSPGAESATPSATRSATKIVELVLTPLGLGLSLDSQYKVVAIAHGSQAERSGSVAVHDQLVALNGQPLGGGVSFEEQLGAIAVGTKLTIEISTSATAFGQEARADRSEQDSSGGKEVLADAKAAQGKELPGSSKPVAKAAAEVKVAAAAPALQAAKAKVAEPRTGTKPKAAPKNIAAVLASCGLEHHTKRFEDEGYTLEKALNALSSGENTLLSDLRDLKLPLGHCRKLITQMKEVLPDAKAAQGEELGGSSNPVAKAAAEEKAAAPGLQATNAEVAEPPTGTEPKAAPENIAAVLASCGLEHHTKRFEDEGYTLEKALNALSSGENTLLSDLRDLKLPLGHCRKLISHLR